MAKTGLPTPAIQRGSRDDGPRVSLVSEEYHGSLLLPEEPLKNAAMLIQESYFDLDVLEFAFSAASVSLCVIN